MNKNDAEKVLKDAEKIKKYIIDAIELDFPSLKIEAIAQYDQVDKDTLAGYVVTKDALIYGFSIVKGENPYLQRFVPKK
jgi:curved DNA-binding protein CbpA